MNGDGHAGRTTRILVITHPTLADAIACGLDIEGANTTSVGALVNYIPPSNSSEGQSLEDVRLQSSMLRQQLVSYSNLLEIYRDGLFDAERDLVEQLYPEAMRILEAKASPVSGEAASDS